MRSINLFLATGFGAGFLPGMPGTFGTVVGLVLYWFAVPYCPWSRWIPLVITALAIPIADAAERQLNTHDDQRIVIDEIAGYFVATIALPHTWPYAVGAFVLFRVFDIWKPWVIRKAQVLQGGLGVVADDVLAGIAANLVLQSIYMVSIR